jgi:hypothetical protein
MVKHRNAHGGARAGMRPWDMTNTQYTPSASGVFEVEAAEPVTVPAQPFRLQRDYAEHGIPASAVGEACGCYCDCPNKATHKLEESLHSAVHPLSLYVCCDCFRSMFGAAHDSYPYDQGESQ